MIVHILAQCSSGCFELVLLLTFRKIFGLYFLELMSPTANLSYFVMALDFLLCSLLYSKLA